MNNVSEIPQVGSSTSHCASDTSNISVRYPGASTPVNGSPEVGMKPSKFAVSRKANTKLPVGQLSQTLDLLSSTKDISKIRGGGMNPNVTVRERGGGRHDGTLSFSPISINESQNPIKLTVPRRHGQHSSTAPRTGKNVSFMDSTGISDKSERKPVTIKARHKNVFPYPDLVEIISPADPGEMLYKSLKTLEIYKRVLKEKQRIPTGVGGGRGRRRDKEHVENTEASYEFTPDMFTSVNTEAFVEVMYLVFSCYDAKETEVRFRDCWPVYEMKMISAFRRVCLDWMKGIFSEHSEFFRDLKIEAISGLLVNPGGDRFISMMRQLCRLVMYKVADSLKGQTRVLNKTYYLKENVKHQVLLPPKPSPDPEIYNRQMHLLALRQLGHLNDTIEEHCEALEMDELIENRLSALDSISECLLGAGNDFYAEVEQFIFENPEIFFNPVDKELPDLIGGPGENNIGSLLSDGTDIMDDHILKGLGNALKLRADEIYKPVSLVENVIQDYEKIWYILEMERTAFPILDLNKIESEWVKDEQGVPSLHTLISNIIRSVHQIISNGVLNSDTSPATLSEFNRLRLRMNFLEALETKVKLQNSCDLQYAYKIIAIGKELKRHYEKFDWSILSGVQEEDFDIGFDMSPMRILDMNRQSGRTPYMHDFLNTSINPPSYSLRQQRRNGSLTKNVANWKSSFRQSTDCVTTPLSRNSSSSHPNLPDHLGNLPKSLTVCENVSSPLSSHPVSRSTSLFHDVSDSSVSTPKLGSLKKSVSFLDALINDSPSPTKEKATPTISNTTSNHAQEFYPASNTASYAPDTQNMSASSSMDGSLIDVSIHERVKRLLQSTDLFSPSSTSPSDSFNDSAKTLREDEHTSNVSSSSNSVQNIKRQEISSTATPEEAGGSKETEDGENVSDVLSSCFENISFADDWADIKGIMETSHTELAFNSDSDE